MLKEKCIFKCLTADIVLSPLQFFLSNRAVYLLLWNVRQGYEHAGLDFWLSSIACHAPKAPIIVVGTHVDKVSLISSFFYHHRRSSRGLHE